MLRPELGKELPDGSTFSAACFFTPLANGFVYVGAGGNIEQALIGSYGPLAPFEVFHEVPGTAAKCRERLNVFGDIGIWDSNPGTRRRAR